MVQHDNKVRRYNGQSIEVAERENNAEVLYEKRNPYLLDYEEERRKQVCSQQKAGSRRSSTVGDRESYGRRTVSGYGEDVNRRAVSGYGEDVNRRAAAGYGEDRNRRAAAGYGEDVNRRTATGYGEDRNRRAASGYGEDVNRRTAAGYGENRNRRAASGYGEDRNRRAASGYGVDVNRRTAAGYGEDVNHRTAVGYGENRNRRAASGYGVDLNRRIAVGDRETINGQNMTRNNKAGNGRSAAGNRKSPSCRTTAEYAQPSNRRTTTGYAQSANRRNVAGYAEASNHSAAARRSANYRRRKRVFMQRMAVSIWVLCLVCLALTLLVRNQRAAGQDQKGNQTVASNGVENVPPKQLDNTQSDPILIQGIPATEFAKHPEWTEDFLTPNEYSRPGDALESVTNIFVHYTANPGTSAAQNRSYFERQKDEHLASVSAHFIIGYEGEIIQCVPLDEIAYAVKSRNFDSISIECCHLEKDGSFTQETYDSLLVLLRWLLDIYDLESEDILRHYDCGGKKCPLYYTEHPDAWEELKKDVDKL